MLRIIFLIGIIAGVVMIVLCSLSVLPFNTVTVFIAWSILVVLCIVWNRRFSEKDSQPNEEAETTSKRLSEWIEFYTQERQN